MALNPGYHFQLLSDKPSSKLEMAHNTTTHTTTQQLTRLLANGWTKQYSPTRDLYKLQEQNSKGILEDTRALPKF